jgi:ferric-dicitrate binding protein FerR (iron transport regulator)
MRDDKSKDEVKLLGDFLRDRAPSVEEEQLVLDRVWQEIGSTDLPANVRQDFRRKAPPTAAIRYAWMGAAAACIVAVALVVFFATSTPPAVVEIAQDRSSGWTATDTGGSGRREASFGEAVRTGVPQERWLALTDGSQIEMRANPRCRWRKPTMACASGSLVEAFSLRPRSSARGISM